jgi:hypothetical protein
MGKISKDGWLQAFNAMGQFASAMDPNPNGVVARLGQTGAQVTESELLRRELKKRKEEEEKARKGGIGSMLGGTVGKVGGALVGGMFGAPVAGAAIGSALGAVGGGKAGRGSFNAGDLLNMQMSGGGGGMLGDFLGGGYDNGGWDVLRKRDRYLGPA